MTTSREKFEEWAAARGYDIRHSLCLPSGYFDERVHHMWDTWEHTWQAGFTAGQEAMRERAKQVCHEAAADRDVTDCIAGEIGRLGISK